MSQTLTVGGTVRHKGSERDLGRGEVLAVVRTGYARVLWTELRDDNGLTDEEAKGTYRIDNLEVQE
jgi:hypothetical protein